MNETKKPQQTLIIRKDESWFKVYSPGKGPIINGSELRNTTATSKSFKEPEPRP